jgi:hypothetical protein
VFPFKRVGSEERGRLEWGMVAQGCNPQLLWRERQEDQSLRPSLAKVSDTLSQKQSGMVLNAYIPWEAEVGGLWSNAKLALAPTWKTNFFFSFKRTVVFLKWYNTCLARPWTWVQSPVLPLPTQKRQTQHTINTCI